MKRNLWIAIIAIFAAVVILLFILKPSHKTRGSFVLNDILSLQQMQISSFDPSDAYHAGHIQMVKQLYNTLVDIDLDGKPVPSLAERWQSTDGKTWRFYLRQNVYFIDDLCFKTKTERVFTGMSRWLLKIE